MRCFVHQPTVQSTAIPVISDIPNSSFCNVNDVEIFDQCHCKTSCKKIVYLVGLPGTF